MEFFYSDLNQGPQNLPRAFGDIETKKIKR